MKFLKLYKDGKKCDCKPSQKNQMIEAGWKLKAPEIKQEAKQEVNKKK